MTTSSTHCQNFPQSHRTTQLMHNLSCQMEFCTKLREYELHEALDFEPRRGDTFCLFSIQFSPSNTHILGGGSDNHVYLYSLERLVLYMYSFCNGRVSFFFTFFVFFLCVFCWRCLIHRFCCIDRVSRAMPLGRVVFPNVVDTTGVVYFLAHVVVSVACFASFAVESIFQRSFSSLDFSA